MEASEAQTKRFLEDLWYRWGQKLIRECAKHYSLSKEQQEALESVLLRPNDWVLEVALPLAT